MDTTENNQPIFIYWDFNARAQMGMLMLHAGNIDYIWDYDKANTWPSFKQYMPFGKLPVLYHNDLIISHSNTIARYCANLSKLIPNNKKDYVLSDMLVEHCEEIYNIFLKAHNLSPSKKLWIKVENNILPVKLIYLSKLLKNNNFFSGDNYYMGDIAVFSIIYLAIQAGLTKCLDVFPTLRNHYKKVLNIGTIKSFVNANHKSYFIAI